MISIYLLTKRVDIFSSEYLCLSIHVEIHTWNLSGGDVKNLFLKFCMSDRFITKAFTLMNWHIKNIHSYAQKYRHFLVKFQYYRDLPKARTIHIVFWQEKKLYVRQKILEKFIWTFSSQIIVEMKCISSNSSYSYPLYMCCLKVPILENPERVRY